MTMSKLGKLLKEKGLEGSHTSGVARHFLDTGYPPLNEIVSGNPDRGLPSGQLVMIAGPSACGKTMIATQLMISAQEHGGFAGFFDYETQYHHDLAKQQGLNYDEDKFYYDKPSTFEKGISAAIELAKIIRREKIIEDDKPIVCVFDSIHAMTPQSKYDNLMNKKGEMTGEKLSMHDNYALSKASSDWFPVIQREFDRYGITGIFLNQVRVKSKAVGGRVIQEYTFPGGDAVYYYCSTVLVLTASNITEDKPPYSFLGKHIKAKTEKSRNTAPFQHVFYDFLIDKVNSTGNFDVLGSYVKHLDRIGAIGKAGSWFEIEGQKVQGVDKVVEHYRSLPDGLAKLVELHKDFTDPESSKPKED